MQVGAWFFTAKIGRDLADPAAAAPVMLTTRPHIVVLAGPNGSGKSTTAPALLKGRLDVQEFVNADTIARGLSAFAPETVAIKAGRIMLTRLDELAYRRHSFAFETTLASRTLAARLDRWLRQGFAVHLLFLWIPDPDMALDRIRERVRLGGHDVPEDTVRRRFWRGLDNLFTIYQPLVTTWRVYDNSGVRPQLVARGSREGHTVVRDSTLWTSIRETRREQRRARTGRTRFD